MGNTYVLCHDRLSFDRAYAIFGQLTDLSYIREGGRSDIPEKPTIKAHPIPPQMWVRTYEDEGIEKTREDKYGDELVFVYAQQLKKLKMPDDASPKNKAIKAFVNALPDDTPIILYWS
ncbi:MAG: hypothetical protein Q8Q46_02005 [Candidatus Giovannonibacteria bacterium]|nr:hypothetical protein [Candidatus Giovannonibacteria bacterium]